MAEHILEVKNIEMTFPDVKALRGVSMYLDAGEILSICGLNGAGKSTLCKVLDGLKSPTAGEIYLEGKKITMSSTREAEKRGIATVHQEPALVPRFTVAENMFLNNEIVGRFGIVDKKRMEDDCRKILSELAFDLDVTRLAASLSLVEQEVVSICRALMRKPKVLILDEVTAPLNSFEVEHLFHIIRDIAKSGVAVIFISHKLVETVQLASRVIVIRDGTKVADAPIAEMDESKIIANMLGEVLNVNLGTEESQIYTTEGKKVKLHVDGLSLGDVFKDISFSLYEGEILGFAGLISAGVTQMMYCIAGIMQSTAGTIEYDGKPVQFRNPRQAIANGIGMLTNNKQRDGLAMVQDLHDNIASASISDYATRLGICRESALTADIMREVKKVDIKASSIYASVRFLSGGNQQKVVFAKWMLKKLNTLLVDEPTHGVDVKTKAEIYKTLIMEKKEGRSIIVYSPETRELLDVCDRIIIATPDGLMGEVRRNTPEFSEQTILNIIHTSEKNKYQRAV